MRSQVSNPHFEDPSGRYHTSEGEVTPMDAAVSETVICTCCGASGLFQYMVRDTAMPRPSRHSTVVEKS